MADGHKERGIWSSLRRPHTSLLATLMGAFALYPLLGDFGWGRIVVSAALLLVMASALVAIWRHHKIAVFGTVLAVGAIVAGVLAYYFEIPLARPILTAIEFTFLSVLSISILLDVMRAKRVTMDTVFGACCVYLMFGMTWTGIYELIEILSPGSFDFGSLGAAESAVAGFETMSKLSYFSFITMTTVGYGDVTPLSPAARAFSSLQGLVGQLYMAIVIARFVAMELSERMQRRD